MENRLKETDRYWNVLSLAPLCLLLFFLTIIPLLSLIYTSFFKVTWSGGYLYEGVGFQNFFDLVENKFYIPGVKNTIQFALITVIIQISIAYVISIVLNKIKYRIIYLSIFMLPILLPPIVIGSIWRLMYGFDFGLFNYLLSYLGIMPIDWLGDPKIAFISIIILDIWHWTPFSVILLITAIEGIPKDILEAGLVDGTNFLKEAYYLITPLIMPTIIVASLFRFIMSFKVFDEIYLLTQGGPGTATEVVSFSIYETYFESDNIGLGSAMSVTTLILIILIMYVVQKIYIKLRLNAHD
ncbi:MAG: sugar ABC transporter permease [Deltaproteobacteria bacterium]|jgi:multiple sugar transport system permease protein|nr:sugar ABC transporter permease [Deltaproteobacteria bacterium]MBT7203698.1 sugar ABC transporter permease [Deltaproteobacteria bacterium]